MTWPKDPTEFLALDHEQQADLLLAGLADCSENERGRNFILFQLQHWFYDLTSGTGSPSTFPTLQAQRQEAKDALEDAYALLESRGLIRADPRQRSFCKLTRAGEVQVASALLPNAERVAFAGRALDGVDLHLSLQNRQVDSHFRQGKFETALRDGSTFLEDSIRSLSGLDPMLVGVKLCSKAFAPNGPLADLSASGSEQSGLQQLYLGFFGAIRNQVMHKDFQYAHSKEGFDALMLLDYLTEKLAATAERQGQQLI
jgi:uncharacterized protein (TIGR02391 family)